MNLIRISFNTIMLVVSAFCVVAAVACFFGFWLMLYQHWEDHEFEKLVLFGLAMLLYSTAVQAFQAQIKFVKTNSGTIGRIILHEIETGQISVHEVPVERERSTHASFSDICKTWPYCECGKAGKSDCPHLPKAN